DRHHGIQLPSVSRTARIGFVWVQRLGSAEKQCAGGKGLRLPPRRYQCRRIELRDDRGAKKPIASTQCRAIEYRGFERASCMMHDLSADRLCAFTLQKGLSCRRRRASFCPHTKRHEFNLGVESEAVQCTVSLGEGGTGGNRITRPIYRQLGTLP